MKIEQCKIKNSQGLELTVLNFGGIIQGLKVPDRSGKLEDIVLGFDDPEDYQKLNHPYFGALIGRVANRVAFGKFQMARETFQLFVNNGPHSLHGGKVGFDKVFWEMEKVENRIKLHYRSPHLEEGYPGELDVHVSYELTDQNELILSYQARTNRKTPVNLTNHSYFNLNPSLSTILDHELMIRASRYTEIDETLLPTGKSLEVTQTKMDFREARKISRGGYDHNFIIDRGSQGPELVATLSERTSGRKMDVFSTLPGLQFYSGNVLDGSLVGKNARPYYQFGGLCLETQFFPDSPNRPEFPSIYLWPDEIFHSQTVYKFSSL